MDALVTDVHTRSAVAGLRALGRAGIPTVALGPSRTAAGLWSRRASARARGPDVTRDPAGFRAVVGRIAEERGPLVVYPVLEEAMDALLRSDSSGLPRTAVLPYRDTASVLVLRDKASLSALAEEVGLSGPQTLVTGTAAELLNAELATPCAVKAMLPERGLGRTHVIEREDHLRALLAQVPRDEPLLLQERVEGQLMAVALVVDEAGRPVARFQQQALRTWPPDAGASRVAVSVEPDQELVEKTARMLSAAGYAGLAQLQFIRTAGGPKLVDVNPRFYGSLPLALAAGVNLAAAWHAVASGGPLPTPADYRTGVTYRWLEAELLAAMRGSPDSILHHPKRASVGAMWAADDPVPSVIMAGHAVGGRVVKRLRRMVRERWRR